MDVSAASLSLPGLYALMGKAMPAAAGPAASGMAIAVEKQALDASTSLAVALLGSLPARSGPDLASALASLQTMNPAAALARLGGGG
jgi:hypothetical protein